ncbi:MAG TPA: DUF4743 domain-containing protein [Sedimenticola thiotaurini]|uniref:DUF4743 domain-containing protein n=1 Tax=Sedimenticola thiotaurini TaxID=1543721 RepID=A0A831RQC8_9GAMM|nr:DUF4743 domain-containing protein [Sedimenticola thiotaurini]
MRLTDYIDACNRWNPGNFLPLTIDGRRVGLVRPSFAGVLAGWEELFRLQEDVLQLRLPPAPTLEQRSRPLRPVLQSLVEQGVLSHLHGEQYPVTPGGPGDGLALIDRAAAAPFGIRAFGQHLNGYVRTDDGLMLWVAKRSADRIHFPGKLDNMVAGGLPWGLTLEQNLAKECREEAGMEAELAARAQPVGALTYVAETDRGLKPDTLYCYDLELPADFRPRCTDGEVEWFELWPVERVLQTLLAGEAFKLNCNLVIIDFLIRHGVIRPDHEEYLDLIPGLHPPLP